MIRTDSGRGRATAARCSPYQTGERNGARAMMTPKQKLEMHKRIVRENARKWREWKKRKGAAA